MIQVPANQQKLIIEIVEPASTFTLCRPELYAARDKQLVIVYGLFFDVDFFHSQYDFGFGRTWNLGGPGADKKLTINAPVAGDYYFAPWRSGLEVVPCPLKYSIKATYYPFPPSNARVTPSSQTRFIGGTASMVVTASGQTPFTYRWERRQGGAITRVSASLNPSANTAALNLNNLAAEDDSEYRAVVSNSGGSTTSAWARVIVQLPPVITAHPQPRTVMPGNSATFNVTATGTAPLLYEWQRRDVNGDIRTLSGATASSLTLNNASYSTHAGAYRVLVKNAALPAGLASQWASLTIGPSIVGLSPANPSVDEGQPVTVAASASGTGPLTYKWYRDGQLFASGFSDTLNIPSAREGDDGPWRLDVQNTAGTDSQNFTLTVIPLPTPPSFIVSPAGAALTEGETLTLSSRALGTRPISYQWFQDNNPAGSGATLIISNVGPQHTGQWKVQASNSLGQKDSTPVTVTVSPGPKFVRQPAGTEIAPGGSLTLSVEAVGRAPLGYQWFRNGQPLGVTGPDLVLTNVSFGDSGYYFAVATNGLGDTQTSLPARVVVAEGAVPPGTMLWKFPCEKPSRLVLHDDGRLVFADAEGLKSLDDRGALEWVIPRASSPAAEFKQLLSAPGGVTIVNGIFYPVSSNRVFAFGPKGEVLWSAISTNVPPGVSLDPRYVATATVERDDVTQIALGGSNDLLVARIYGSGDFANLSLYSLTSEAAASGLPEQPFRTSALHTTYHHLGSLTMAVTRNGRVRSAQHALAGYRVVESATSPNNQLIFRFASDWYYVHLGAVDGEFPSPSYNLSDGLQPYEFGRVDWNWAHLYGLDSIYRRIRKTADQQYYAYYWSEPSVYAIGSDESLYVGCRLPNFSGALYRFSPGVLSIPNTWYREVGEMLNPYIGWGYPVLNKANQVIRLSGTLRLSKFNYFDKEWVGPPTGPERLWDYPNIRSTAALADDDSTYAAGRETNTTSLHALDRDGQKIWEFITPIETHVSSGSSEEISPVIGADGTVYFPAGDAIYAVKGTVPIMDSSWPIYAGNVRRTWRAQQLPTVPQLASGLMLRGDTISFDGTSGGLQPIRYQWLKDGEFIPGATNAALGLPGLRGFDSGRYVVRVSNPTGDRLSPPASLRVVMDPQPFVGVPQSIEAAFTNSPASANTFRDDWQFFHSINETNRRGRYAHMSFQTNGWPEAGLLAWRASSNSTSAAGFNTSAVPVVTLGATIPAGRVFMNPGIHASNCVALAWMAEAAGYYAVTGRLSRLANDASGDGVRWYLDAGRINFVSGALGNSTPETNITVAGLYLKRGERLHLILSPGENATGDLTGVELEVRLTELDPTSEPGFLLSPQNISVLAGQNAAFSAVVDASPEPDFQWQRSVNTGATWEALPEGADFSGVNTSNLTVFATTGEMNGHLFRLEAINAAGSALSGAARLTVTDGPQSPTFVLQPQAVTAFDGGQVILTAGAEGTGPLSFQWYHNGLALAGQTGAMLTLNGASSANSGTYFVVVSNALGSQTSAVANVTVDLPPGPPVLGLVATTDGASVKLSGQPGSRWKLSRKESLDEPWQVWGLGTADGAGDLSWLDANTGVSSAFYRAEFAPPPLAPEIAVQPQTSAFAEFSEGILNLLVEGSGPFTYQWWRDGTLLSGETNHTFILGSMSTNDVGSYFAVVSNAYGAVTSQVATVTVAAPAGAGRIENIRATASSEFTALQRYASNTLNGVYVDGNFWESGPGDTNPAIAFDLHGVYRLSHLVLWNSHEFGPGIKRMVLEYSLDGTNYEAFGELELAPGTNSDEPSDSISLPELEARYLRFDMLENQDGQIFTNAFLDVNRSPHIAIDEVEFFGELSQPVPVEIQTQPLSVTNLAGVTNRLTLAANGTLPLGYQWWKDGAPLTNGTSPALELAPVLPSHGGSYTVIIFNSAGETASASAIVTVATNEPLLAVPTNGLLAYYPLNNSAQDASGTGRHASSPPGLRSVGDRLGIFGGALAFANAPMTVAGIAPDAYAAGFSFGCWFLIQPETVNLGPLLFWLPTGDWGLTYVQYVNGGFDLRCGSGSSTTQHDVRGLTIPRGQWHHIMITHGATVDRLYLNGVQVGEWPTLPLLNNDSVLQIGQGFGGALDDVTIFGRELTPAEVQLLAAP